MTLTLVAEVYAFDPSVRSAYLDTTRAFFNGPSLLVWPVGHHDRPCELEIAHRSAMPTATGGWRPRCRVPARSCSASASIAPKTMTS